MTKTLSLLAGVAMLAGATGASAADLLTADQMDGVTAGTLGYFNLNVDKDVNIYENIDINKDVDINVDTHVSGWSADAEAIATASGGYGSNAETLTVSDARAGSSFYVGWPCYCSVYTPGQSFAASGSKSVAN